jgi:hypothetical protein
MPCTREGDEMISDIIKVLDACIERLDVNARKQFPQLGISDARYDVTYKALEIRHKLAKAFDHDKDGFEVRRIEVDFAMPVEMTQTLQRLICDLVNGMARATETPDIVHWQAGCGSKPIWNEPEEPTWDDTVYRIDTFARERYETEPFGKVKI